MSKRIRKAVFPVAGLGTRVLPATKTVPKEMLTVVDRPVLQHCVEEAREAGIEHFVFVTGRNKAVIEDHFDMAYELEDTLQKRGKLEIYKELMADLPAAGATSFTRQQAPLGLGHAVWCARDIIGDEPFAVMLPDMITLPGSRGSRCIAQCIEQCLMGCKVVGDAIDQRRRRGGIVARWQHASTRSPQRNGVFRPADACLVIANLA